MRECVPIYIILFNSLFKNVAMEKCHEWHFSGYPLCFQCCELCKGPMNQILCREKCLWFSILLCMWDCTCGFPDSDREKSSRKKFSSHSLVWNWLCDFKGLSSISFLPLFCIIILSPITICLLYHHFHQYFFYFWRMFLKGNISLWLLLLSEFDIQNHENLKMTVLQLC